MTRLRRQKRRLLGVILTLAVSLAAGAGVSLLRSQAYLPSLDGDISALAVADGKVLCGVSRDQDSLLLRLDTDGTLLNYCRIDADRVFQELAVSGMEIYALEAAWHNGETTQKLVSLSLEDVFMTPKTLADLSQLPQSGVLWQSLTLTGDGGVLLGGRDSEGNGYTLTWQQEGGCQVVEEVLPGAEALYLSALDRGRVLWVDRSRRLNLRTEGRTLEGLLDGQADTPLQPLCQGDGWFVSDSVTGDLYQIAAGGSAKRLRSGDAPLANSGYTYSQYAAYTVYSDPGGSLRTAGVCASGQGTRLVGELLQIDNLRSGGLRPLLLWQHGWPAALAAFGLLALAEAWLGRLLRSPRLSTRLTLCELTVAALLLAAVTAIQYRAYQDALLEEARQQLHLLGGGLAIHLEADAPMTEQALREAVEQMEAQVSAALAEEGRAYTLRVLWQTPDGPSVACDGGLPSGYLLEDVESRNYLALVRGVLASGGSRTQLVRGEISSSYLYVQTFRQGGRTGCVAVSQARELLTRGQARFFGRMLPILAVCPPLFLALLWFTRRLLAPLDAIRAALEEFCTCGGGHQMELEHIPRTDLYEVGRVFNQLSVEVKTQFNTLQTINDAYRRLVPNSLLEALGKPDVSALRPGETVTLRAALLVAAPVEREGGPPAERTNGTAEAVGAFGGVVVDHDEGLDSLTALFLETGQALACAGALLEGGRPVMTAVLEETVVLGVFGGQHLLLPLVLSPSMARRLAVLALLLRFGARAVRCGGEPAGLRLLGWDNGLIFYEDPAWRTPHWQSAWREGERLWTQALELYRRREFGPAMRKLARFLRLLPEDQAARWYLFRCEALRDAGEKRGDTDLLYGWRDDG